MIGSRVCAPNNYKRENTMAETTSFKFADRRITQLLETLAAKQTCPCCTARALLYHGAVLYERTSGSAKAVEELEDIVASLLENAVPAPDCDAHLH
jgi:hypothetical protein